MNTDLDTGQPQEVAPAQSGNGREFISAATGEPVRWWQARSEDGTERYTVVVCGGNSALAFRLVSSDDIVLLVRPGREEEDFGQLIEAIKKNGGAPLPFRRADAEEDAAYFTTGRLEGSDSRISFLALIGDEDGELRRRIEKGLRPVDAGEGDTANV